MINLFLQSILSHGMDEKYQWDKKKNNPKAANS